MLAMFNMRENEFLGLGHVAFKNFFILMVISLELFQVFHSII